VTKQEKFARFNEAEDQLIQCEMDSAVQILSLKRIRIKAQSGYGDSDKSKWHVITIKDVIEYYRTQAGNISSGWRQIGDIGGDWRPIDSIAKDCLNIFKILNIEKLREEAKAQGMQPKF
jgi:hypothetical protein